MSDIALVTTMIKNKRQKQLRTTGYRSGIKFKTIRGLAKSGRKKQPRAILRHFCINRRDHEKLIWVGNRLQSDLRKKKT